MPLLPPSFVPTLVEQILEKYKEQTNSNVTNSSECVNKKANKNLGTDLQKQLFVELNAVFGEVLKRALRLLDEQTITVFTDELGLREIAEITEGRRTSRRTVRLFPGTNYCRCEYFTRAVLKLEVLPANTCCSSSSSIRSGHEASCSYTCEHVLALRLAVLLRAASLRTETLPKDKFKRLLSEMQFSDSLC